MLCRKIKQSDGDNISLGAARRYFSGEVRFEQRPVVSEAVSRADTWWKDVSRRFWNVLKSCSFP